MFRDTIMAEPTPISLKAVDDALQIVWSDGVTHRLTWKQLREACPCASCREKREQRAAVADSDDARSSSPPRGQGAATAASELLPVLSLAETRPLSVTSMKPVGNYAYDIDFSDGHTTGIYTLEHLRELGDAARTEA